jgi:hypothetical protein
MRIIPVAGIVIAGAAATISLSGTAHAQPNAGPCRFMIMPICSIIPVMPELDHDVDLTTDPNALNSDAGGDLGPNATDSGD